MLRGTFGLLRWVSARSLSAVEAVSFDTLQMQHLGVLTNAVDLVSDSVQGHNLSLCGGKKKKKVYKARKAPVKQEWRRQ